MWNDAFLCVPLPDDYLKELKDQPTQSDENVLADRLNVLSQAATGMGDNSTPIWVYWIIVYSPTVTILG